MKTIKKGEINFIHFKENCLSQLDVNLPIYFHMGGIGKDKNHAFVVEKS